MKDRRRAVAAGALLALLVIAAAWGFESWASRETGTPSGAVYSIDVVRAGHSLGRLTLEDLKALGTRRVYMQDQWEEGPTLLAALSSVGAGSFTRVTVIGLGARDDGRLTLKRSDVDQQVILDLALRGTAKLCGPKIPYEKRVRDVTQLVVE